MTLDGLTGTESLSRNQEAFGRDQVCKASLSVEVDRTGEPEWAGLLQKFEDATVYQTRPYGSVRWGEKALSHFVLTKNGETMGCGQARIARASHLPIGFAYMPWGPLWWPKGKARDLDSVRQVAAAVRDEYLGRHLPLVIAPNVMETEPDAARIDQILKEEGFRRLPDSEKTSLLDLTPTVDKLRSGCSSNWRWSLRRAEKFQNRLRVVEGEAVEGFAAFVRLYGEMVARKRFVPGVNIDDFFEMQKRLPEGLKMKTILCYSGDELVSGAVFSALGNRGLMLHSATSPHGRELCASHLVWWHIAQRLKGAGYTGCDLGGVNAEIAPGPYRFKKGMGGTEASRLGFYFVSSGVLGRMAIRTGYWAKPWVRKAKGCAIRIGHSSPRFAAKPCKEEEA